ncbi:hypothetical protein [Desulfofustis glycolicus]|uniref:Replication initiation factor n=1 Tax=Desulfofustis glycolicus DSM 9705 TaxID=1121409 RepID=A0A1M5SES6_9BACT|nr:hypothetical protein [Desulfofustis glycolicus]MCB2216118.1 hypothetical protein [Desulfobulbaceae bacterium]SHH37097.1 hypothetical protein SAMN02745124_00316 [Desulfofustis glycolicus DSM 9705]
MTTTPTTRNHPPVSSHSQAGLTRGVQLSKGLDRLKFGLYVQFESTRFFDILTDAKEEAQDQRSQIPIRLGPDNNYDYNCHSNGRKGGYNFHLSRADVDIFISTRKDYLLTPNVWVDIGSASCWSPGYNEVIYFISKLINLWDGKIIKNSVSEVHLCTDFIGLDIETLPLQSWNRWVTRANRLHSFSDRNRFSGITLTQTEGTLNLHPDIENDDLEEVETGIRIGEGDIMMRIYDKVLEIKRNGSKQSLFASVWNKTEYNQTQVTRVEFQLRKNVLKQFRIRSLEDLKNKQDGLWKYCTHEWARLSKDPIDRKNRHQDRAKLHGFWQLVQSVSWGTSPPTTRRKPLPQKDKYLLLDMMVGCAMNMAAIDGCKYDNIDQITMYLMGEVDTWCRTKAREINPKTGRSELQEKMKTKINEVWPYGYGEIPGPSEYDSMNGFFSHGKEITIQQAI